MPGCHKAVTSFCRESGCVYNASKGFGVQQAGRGKLAGEPGYEVVRQKGGQLLVEINADHWKSYVHSRLQTPVGQPGGLTLFHGTAHEHLGFAKHLTAEKRVEEFISGRGWSAAGKPCTAIITTSTH